MQVFERGWLSSNNVLLRGGDGPGAVVDTGYGLHAAQTVALVERALDDAGLDAIVNTHLHSDHCGGNAALQRRWPAVTTLVPEACFDAARDWDESALTFSATDQRCERFAVDQALRAGQVLQLGASQWEVHAAPGHDPTAVMLFQPQAGLLISADALWEQRLAIVFPELVGESGFADCLATLDAIERLNPAIVVPGHGRPFVDIATALDASRRRLDAFARNPAKHRQHAVRALVMFHMLEVRRVERSALADWLLRTPITAHAHAGVDDVGRTAWANGIVDSLIADQALREEACGVLVVAAG
jgi:glyoxylase-like metal-dependent hydrolase (beta-lactamase superfamily II)